MSSNPSTSSLSQSRRGRWNIVINRLVIPVPIVNISFPFFLEIKLPRKLLVKKRYKGVETSAVCQNASTLARGKRSS
ncbi:hypothetical protein K504DRAFT_82351 [Pleomassaria siparia CBS 279.74]|uniref:Uncharacterized protein n=1 Tax=Pleomassaria siparia CBS 279.74 TaxID=1314801 RepID=A0A6G1K0T9_9PLEO|nr:hypothetical protein K504DRAFT_82351 [Pleomassaria siparia CBS 279.74]